MALQAPVVPVPTFLPRFEQVGSWDPFVGAA